MRIFFCFSSKDRHSIVESLLYHLDNYSIPVWYDRREMLMGDPRNFKNFIEGVGLCNYAIIILSPNSIASKCANEEIILIKDKYEKGQMTIFPIFFNITADSLDNNYLWMKQLVYKELVPEIDSVGACNHIVCKILLDELSKFPILTLNDYISKYEHVSMHCFLVSLMKSYMELYDGNYNARLALLFAAYSYLIMHFDTFEIPQYYYQGIHHLFNQTKLLLSIENREILIAERSLLLLLNASFGTGMRIGELCGLRNCDVDLERGLVRIIGKGNKERVVDVCMPVTLAALREWVQVRETPTDTNAYFFTNRLGHGLSPQIVRLLVHQIAKECNIDKNVTPHTFRHTFATLLLEENVDVFTIQHILGHSSISTTQIYLHVNPVRQRDVLTNHHPRSRM